MKNDVKIGKTIVTVSKAAIDMELQKSQYALSKVYDLWTRIFLKYVGQNVNCIIAENNEDLASCLHNLSFKGCMNGDNQEYIEKIDKDFVSQCQKLSEIKISLQEVHDIVYSILDELKKPRESKMVIPCDATLEEVLNTKKYLCNIKRG